MYKKMYEFVEETLSINGGIKSKNLYQPFRNRFEHIQRVVKWLERLLLDYPECDHQIAYTAAIFHDVGYSSDINRPHHGDGGAAIFKEYAIKTTLTPEQIKSIENIILNHSNKELILAEETPIEMVLVLEADMLDEEGALGLSFDLMLAGAKMPSSYQVGLDEIMIHTAHILEQNPMKTTRAKKYWEQKKEFVRQFIDMLSLDLEQKKEID